MSIVAEYLEGLSHVLPPDDRDDLALTTGATPDQLEQLLDAYPLCPPSLLQLLGKINGTHWQTCGDREIAVLILGSDLFQYPYYLRSVEQILEDRQQYNESIRAVYGQYLDQKPEILGKYLDPDINMGERLCFSHCMNNGGTSKLYIDFSPASGGVVGQVVRFVHDPDEYRVIASSFDEYLRYQMSIDFEFVVEGY